MTFGNELWLYALVIPFLGLLWSVVSKKRSQSKSGLPKAARAQASFSGISLSKGRSIETSKWFFYLGLTLVVIAMARPQWGEIERDMRKRSREVIIAMDLSKSMLAEDIKPNRLARAKIVVGSLLDNLAGESVGLIVFAGTAFLQSPMSPDYQILRGFLKDLNPSFIPQGGTNYEAMIETALDSFEQSDGMADRFLIVISDGESLDDSWKESVEELKQQNVKAICLGFGTTQGGLIPDGSGGYHKDDKGAVVLTKLEARTLQDLARQSDGVYKEANVWVDLAALIEETVKQGRAGETDAISEVFHVERYQYFLTPGLLFLLVSLYREFPSLPKARTISMRRAHG